MASDMTIILMMARGESNFRLFSSARSFIIARLLFYHFSPRAHDPAIFMQGQEGKILSDRDELRLTDDDNSPLSTMKINDNPVTVPGSLFLSAN